MKTVAVVSLVFTVLAVLPARAADNLPQRLATCQDSWLDWKDDPVRMTQFADSIKASFTQKPDEPYWVPKSPLLVVDLPVLQVYPESVGMGVGFSVVVDAAFDQVRTQVEKTLGKSITHCESGDGMRACDLEIGEKRTLVLMADDNKKAKPTLVGCYYFYEK